MNNEEKNTYAKNQIKNTVVELMKDYELSDLSIGKIADKAMVSRNAFYRNYNSKEDIIYEYVHDLINGWKTSYEKNETGSPADLYGNLFQHLSEHKDFYILLKKRNLFHLFLRVMISLFGPKPEHDNMAAYTTAFITYGTYGWIEEWIGRGMQESGEMMTVLLSANNMK